MKSLHLGAHFWGDAHRVCNWWLGKQPWFTVGGVLR